jgi:hypothetical protein
VVIDVFTRRAGAIPMKRNDTSQALETVCENNFVPTVLTVTVCGVCAVTTIAIVHSWGESFKMESKNITS